MDANTGERVIVLEVTTDASLLRTVSPPGHARENAPLGPPPLKPEAADRAAARRAGHPPVGDGGA